jgi:hypothetical protein
MTGVVILLVFWMVDKALWRGCATGFRSHPKYDLGRGVESAMRVLSDNR